MSEAGTARARVLAALRGERVRPVPVGAVTQSASVAQMEALGTHWPDAHFDASLMAGLAAGAHTLLGFDLVRVPFDQTIEAELLGAQVDYGDQVSNCAVRRHPLAAADPLPLLPDLGRGRPQAVVEAIRKLRRRMAEKAAVLGGIVGPFTLVCQLLGVSTTLVDALRRPDVLRPWLHFAVKLSAEYARRQVEAGADAICVEDMSASLDLTSPAIYRDLILPAQRQLIAGIGVPVILHVCGSNTRILDLLAASGATALSLETRTDLAQAVSCHNGGVVGGVAPVEVLLNGSVEDVRKASAACLAAGVHLLAPGCGIAPKTPTPNLREMTRVAREWRR